MKLRATLRVRNDEMIRARWRKGLSQPRLAEAAGCKPWVVMALEKLDYTSLAVTENVEKIACVLELDTESVMPLEMSGGQYIADRQVIEDVPVSRMIASQNEMRGLLPSPVDIAEEKELKERISEILNTMNDRDREVISLRFGLNDGKEYTLEEISRACGVTKERVRQIEFKALNQIRDNVDGVEYGSPLDVDSLRMA